MLIQFNDAIAEVAAYFNVRSRMRAMLIPTERLSIKPVVPGGKAIFVAFGVLLRVREVYIITASTDPYLAGC